MKVTKDKLVKMITEAIADRIAAIDEAGDVAAKTAKISHIDEEISKAQALKSHMMAAGSLREYTTKTDEMLKEIDGCIAQLEAKKAELQGKKKGIKKKAFDKKKQEKSPLAQVKKTM